jgi:EAL domain-containing protein (putative c-di-GMP-specific phosphodiesterase class I)
MRLEADTYNTVNSLHRAARLPAELSIVSGIAISAAPSNATELLQQARIALTAAELAGRPMRLYSPELRDGIVGRARTVRLLTAAVDRDEFELHYQPVLDAVTGVRVSVEALVRWRHHGRLHAPAEWIPIAEQQRLMPAIGVKVLQIAAGDYPALGCPIAVNVSPRQFTDVDFAATVLAALGDCPPSALILEVTESSVMSDPVRANEALELLRAHGIRIALDDFGTEYSSLSRLSTVPFDIVKIDRSFVSRVLSHDGRAIVAAIHALACALGKTTVAEGVETSMQLQAVQEIGCDLVQGFLTGRPVPLSELLAAHVVGLDGLIEPSDPRWNAEAGQGARLSDRGNPQPEPTDRAAGRKGRRYSG